MPPRAQFTSSTPFFIRPIRDVADEDSRNRGISEQVPGATRSAPLRADNTDVVFYEYAMPDSVDDIRFQAVIDNDYSVDVVGAVQVRTIAVGDDELFYDWQNVLRADGRPRNSANLRQVEFTYGFPTGLSILATRRQRKHRRNREECGNNAGRSGHRGCLSLGGLNYL